MGVHLFLVLFLDFCCILVTHCDFYVTTPRDPTCLRIFLVGLRYNRFDSMEHLEPFLCYLFYVFIFPYYNFQCTYLFSLHVFNIISNPYDSVKHA